MSWLAVAGEAVATVSGPAGEAAGGEGGSPQVSLTPQTRVLAALIAIAFTAFVLDLIRRHRLQERYSVIWFAAGLAMLLGAAFPGLLEVVAGLMGVRDTNVALFSLILLLLLGLALNFSIIASRQAEQITRLAQEQAIATAEEQAASAVSAVGGGAGEEVRRPGDGAGGSQAPPG